MMLAMTMNGREDWRESRGVETEEWIVTQAFAALDVVLAVHLSEGP
jgi:hypothetical protein